jgi:hypothetical protein
VGFYRVRAPEGRELYVQTGDVRRRAAAAPAPRVTGEELVATALEFLGVPYQWGGMSALGIDCSGFVAVVYRFHGVELYRDADLQMDDPAMLAVERHELAPGDLLFFGERSVTHVGLYAGGGEFVSATTYARPMVRRDRLDDPYWAAALPRRAPAALSTMPIEAPLALPPSSLASRGARLPARARGVARAALPPSAADLLGLLPADARFDGRACCRRRVRSTAR